MALVNISELIKSERLKRGITQEELAYGICTATTLSRIERGLHKPSKITIISLLERLGDVDCSFSANLTDSEKEISNITHEINTNLSQHQYEKAKKNISRFKNCFKTPSNLINQYIFWVECEISIGQNELTNSVYCKLIRAIQFTVPIFDETISLDILLTKNETSLIRLLAHFHYLLGNRKKAMLILNNLLICYENQNLNTDFKANIYADLLLDKIHYLIKQFKYKEAYKTIELRNHYCIHNIHYEKLYSSAYYKISCEKHLGLESEAFNTAVTTYYTIKSIGMDETALEFRQRINSDFGIDFIIVFE